MDAALFGLDPLFKIIRAPINSQNRALTAFFDRPSRLVGGRGNVRPCLDCAVNAFGRVCLRRFRLSAARGLLNSAKYNKLLGYPFSKISTSSPFSPHYRKNVVHPS